MRDFKIFTDTGADNNSFLEEKGVTIVPLYITFDNETYLKQYEEISVGEFYERVTKPFTIHPKTSLPSVQDFVDAFKPILEQGLDILYFSLASKLSGTIQSALNAREMLLIDFPDATIECIDSYTVTANQTYITALACDMKNAGKSIEEIKERIERLRETTNLIFIVDTLKFLKEGGRIGKAAALVGELLNLKPVLMLEKQVIVPYAKSRGKNKAIATMIDKLKKDTGENINDYYICIFHGGVEEEAKELKKEIEDTLSISHVEIMQLGICIGLHVGPGSLGLCYLDKRI